MSDLFEEFRRAAQERAAAPQAPSYAEQLRAILEETRDPRDERRAKIEALAAQGATAGEREAALSALRRMDDEDARLEQDARDEADFEDARAHGEA